MVDHRCSEDGLVRLSDEPAEQSAAPDETVQCSNEEAGIELAGPAGSTAGETAEMTADSSDVPRVVFKKRKITPNPRKPAESNSTDSAADEAAREEIARRVAAFKAKFDARRRRPGTSWDGKANKALLAKRAAEKEAEELRKKTQDGPLSYMSRKFVPMSGRSGEHDPEMEAWVDKQIALREKECMLARCRLYDDDVSPADEAVSSASVVPTSPKPTPNPSAAEIARRERERADTAARQAAMQGRLEPVDLGPEARERNIRRTEAAIAKLERGEQLGEADEGDGKKKARNRGRYWTAARAAADKDRELAKKRKLEDERKIDEALREAKPEPRYRTPSPTRLVAENTNEPTDDSFAEQFRRDWLESHEPRRQPRKPATNNVGLGSALAKVRGEETSKSRGPRLGGSRSARAAMHRAMEDEKKKGQEGAQR